jgi:type I restriction-modification system DNA methylase subunit
MIEPYKGIIYDPACGTGGMFVQSVKFIEAHQGDKREVSICGLELMSTTYKLAKMNLAIRGISANLGALPADTFGRDQHPDLKAEKEYENFPEFCYSANIEEVRNKDYSLVPSKYIGFVNRNENIDFDEKMKALQTEFSELLKAEELSKKELLNVF